jgi:phospholipid N-methyltransferase
MLKYIILFIFVVVLAAVIAYARTDTVRKLIHGGMNEFINRTKHSTNPYLYTMIKPLIHKGRALSLGTGAGVIERELLSKGWRVTCTDVNSYSDEVMNELMDEKQKENYTFIKSKASELKLDGKYDLIFAQNVLPFDDKKKITSWLNNAHNHLTNNGVLAFTLFGHDTVLVKNKKAWGVNANDPLLASIDKMKLIYTECQRKKVFTTFNAIYVKSGYSIF